MISFLKKSILAFLLCNFSYVQGYDAVAQAHLIYQSLSSFIAANVQYASYEVLDFKPVQNLLKSQKSILNIHAFNQGTKTLLEVMEEYRQDSIKKKNHFILQKRQAEITRCRKLIEIYTRIIKIIKEMGKM